MHRVCFGVGIVFYLVVRCANHGAGYVAAVQVGCLKIIILLLSEANLSEGEEEEGEKEEEEHRSNGLWT